ncbi:conjugal transfer protein TraG N-terminal domain-containing protein [Novosphingobium sp. UBA1939]|uniref:conjugal transfer protein TraG N-terminal domain-containing protein n=1 Tax=Novosphingobium sp. UBA1939 TaxID=1946982 RepID=UPI0025CB8905|nr:conjugal transfer protein TraG N-terminal domain-containing protein [Novosphingobium sp. UBA1939]
MGGGEYLVNVFNAIAAWSGAGGYRALLRVVMVMGFAMALMTTAWNMDPRALIRWFMQATLMYMVLMVPTTSVKVTDRTNPGLAPAVVANVPIGLAGIASFTSQIGDYLTTSAETVFVMPASLNYSTGGMIYGAKLLDATQNLRIDDPTLALNLNEHFKQCVFYDVLMGRKSIESITQAPDMLAAMAPGSVSLSQTYRYPDGSSNIVSCQSAYNLILTGWNAYYTAALPRIAQQFFPGISTSAAETKFSNDVGAIGATAFGGSGTSAQQLTRQAMMVNAMTDAVSNFSNNQSQSVVDAFAASRADVQTRNTYATIAAGAMKWVPLLNIVLTVVFYAMFPIIFLLTLLPNSGIGVIKGYITGFFYLASWGPLFVVLNMIFMTRWQSSLASWNSAGLTAANFAGVSAINQDAGALAGFMIMSVPFIAAGMARGAMSIASQSTSFLAPSQNAAEQAASEQTTGNYAYGNRQYNNLTAHQQNDAPSYTTGAPQFFQRNADGTMTRTAADGTMSYDSSGGMSSLPFTLHSTSDFARSMEESLTKGAGVVEQKRQVASDAWSTANSASMRLFETAQHSASSNTEVGRGLQNSLATVNDLQTNWSSKLSQSNGFTKSESDELARSATREGQFSADAAISAMLGPERLAALKGSGSVSARWAAHEARNSKDGSRTEKSLLDGLSFLEQQSRGDSARQARESFYRQTSASSDSQLRGLSQEVTQDLRHAQSASEEASRAEDTFQRYQNSFAERRNNNFSISRNDTQDYVRFVQEQMLDPANRNLDHTYRPGQINQTASQQGTENILLKRYENAKIAQMQADLGLIPQAPAPKIAGPSFSSAEDIQRIAHAGMAGVAAQGPQVAVRGHSADTALDNEVGNRITSSQATMKEHGDTMRNQVLGEGGRQADIVRQSVGDRLSSSLLDTVPFFTMQTPREQEEARRHVQTKPGVNLSGVSEKMWPAFDTVTLAAKGLNLPAPVVTSGRDGRHMVGSLHPSGRALDFRGNNISVTQGRQLATLVGRRLGPDYDVAFETFPHDPSRNHLHAEYDPKGKGRR